MQNLKQHNINLVHKTYITGYACSTVCGDSPELLWSAVNGPEQSLPNGLGFISNEKHSSNRTMDIAVRCISQAMDSAGWQGLREDDGLIIGTTAGQLPVWEGPLMDFSTGKITKQQFVDFFKWEPLGVLTEEICSYFNFSGRRQTISTACSASTHAIALGCSWLAQGKVNRCIVGGVDVLPQLIVEGFKSLQLLTSEPARPFDRDRKGINLSEGAAFLCLERDSNGENVFGISGYGMSCDAFHPTAPHPEGNGSYSAMASAVRMAGIKPSDVDWVHAHGTGSVHNDISESRGIVRLFSNDNIPPVSSTKGIHGHTLAASGAVESVICLEALKAQRLAPTNGLRNVDPEIKLPLVRESKPAFVRYVLKNSLGFGGANGALVFFRETNT